MILDFTYPDVMRMMVIKRWGIISMTRTQSVAEHSYNVAMMALNIYNNSRCLDASVERILMLALTHDLPEIHTGDIPMSLKTDEIKQAVKEYENAAYPQLSAYKYHCMEIELLVVKIADIMEAITYCRRYSDDPYSNEVVQGLYGAITNLLNSIPDSMVAIRDDLKEAIDKSWRG